MNSEFKNHLEILIAIEKAVNQTLQGMYNLVPDTGSQLNEEIANLIKQELTRAGLPIPTQIDFKREYDEQNRYCLKVLAVMPPNTPVLIEFTKCLDETKDSFTDPN